MHPVLQKNVFLVNEHLGIFKAANNYDIVDPESQEMLMECREPNLGWLTKILRFTEYKRMTPFEVQITGADGQPVVTVKRGISIFLSKVDVIGPNGNRIGGFKQKFFSIGAKFDVLDAADNPICTMKGKLIGWDFYFNRPDGTEVAHVSKKWAGLATELFTSKDTYVLGINEAVAADDPVRELVMAAVMVIDMVLKE